VVTFAGYLNIVSFSNANAEPSGILIHGVSDPDPAPLT
jgi:hypothetical protein